MTHLIVFINQLLTLYVWIIIAVAVLSWLIAFDVVNMRNPIVRAVWTGLSVLTEPALRPIRSVLPNLGGIDVSPIILIIIIWFIQSVILTNIADLLR